MYCYKPNKNYDVFLFLQDLKSALPQIAQDITYAGEALARGDITLNQMVERMERLSE